jgi:anaerobic selenocysteine-containing dehydrogenase
MGVVQASRGNLRPISGDLRSEPAIVAQLAQAVLGDGNPVDWTALGADYDRIRDAIEAVIPGFEQYNERARQPQGFYLPNSAREGLFPTASTGRANFHCSQVEPLALPPDALIMMTVRSHDQFNTTIYGLDDRYRGVYDERRVVFMHPRDAAARGLGTGDIVDLINDSGGRERVARKFIVVPYDIPERCCATYFPEANVLVPIDRVARKSNTPTSKWVPIRVQKSQD